MKTVYYRTKGFVSRHKVGLAFGAGATAMFLFHRGTIKEWNEFLAEKDLTDEFYKEQ